MRLRVAHNGMHPTANSAALIVSLNACSVVCAAGDAGRSASSFSVSLIIEDINGESRFTCTA